MSGMLLLLACSVGTSAVAGPWTQPKGDTYTKIAKRSVWGTGSAFAADGRVVSDLPGYVDARLEGYFEGGLSDTLTAIAFASPVGIARYNGASTAYVGPIGVGARQALVRQRYVVAVEARYSYAPRVGNGPLGAAFQTPERQLFEYLPTIEDHTGDVALALGRSTRWGWWWTSAGTRLHTADGVDHAVVATGQLGFPIAPRWSVDGRFDFVQPFGEVVVNNISGVGQTAYLGWTLTASFDLDEAMALVFGLGGAFYARANAATPALHFGVAF